MQERLIAPGKGLLDPSHLARLNHVGTAPQCRLGEPDKENAEAGISDGVGKRPRRDLGGRAQKTALTHLPITLKAIGQRPQYPVREEGAKYPQRNGPCEPSERPRSRQQQPPWKACDVRHVPASR